MWQLSGFADEISADVNEQCRIFQGLGIHHLEVRSAWGTNVLDLDLSLIHISEPTRP